MSYQTSSDGSGDPDTENQEDMDDQNDGVPEIEINDGSMPDIEISLGEVNSFVEEE